MKSNIRKLRNEKQISQTTLANVIGKTQQTVSHMEKDRDRISIESLITLADYFGVSTDYILGLEPRGRFDGKPEGQSDLQNLNGKSSLSGTDNLKNNLIESKETLYQLILSLLLCSLEDKTLPMPWESNS